MGNGAIIASLVTLVTILVGTHYWCYRRGKTEGEKKAYEKSKSAFKKYVLPLVNNPNSLFNIMPESESKKDKP
jgi:hypothetical protein